MNLAEALAEMRAKGIVLFLDASPDDGRTVLRWRAGPGIVTTKTIPYITRHKQELIDLLHAEAAANAERLRLEAARVFFDAEPDDDADDGFPSEFAETDELEPDDWLNALALEDALADDLAVPEALRLDVEHLLDLPDDVFAAWKRAVEREQFGDEQLARDRQAVALADRIRVARLAEEDGRRPSPTERR
jgi:hypothetical protein